MTGEWITIEGSRLQEVRQVWKIGLNGWPGKLAGLKWSTLAAAANAAVAELASHQAAP